MNVKPFIFATALLALSACTQTALKSNQTSNTAPPPSPIVVDPAVQPPGTTAQTAGTSPISPVGVLEPAAASRFSGWSGKPSGGFFHCELGNKIESRVQSDDAVQVIWKGKTYAMNRVGTASGAVRMEDKISGLVWIQIPAKSFLLDSKKGQQLANECLVKE